MRTHTSGFTDALKSYGRELDTTITYGENTLDNEDINRVNLYFNTELLKTVMKAVEFDTNTKIDKYNWVNIQSGVKVSGSFEYLDYGNYYINEEPTYNADTRSYTHKAYDKMIESMIPYDSDPLEVIYPITTANYLNAICLKLGWALTTESYANMSTEIASDMYAGLGLTYRDILDDLCPIVGGNLMFDVDDNLIIKNPTDTLETIDDESLKDTNVVIGKKYGPVNSLVLSRADGGDNIYRQDADSIATNGLCELKVIDNIILDSEDRENFIDEIFNTIKGIEYQTYDISTIGLCVYEPLDIFTFSHNGTSYKMLMLNDNEIITQGLKEDCYVDEPKDATTDYSTSAPTDKSIRNAVMLAKKNDALIKLLTNSVNENTSNIADLEISTGEISSSVADVSTNLTNNYKTAEQTQALIDGNTQDITDVKAQITSMTQTATDLQVQITSINTNGVSKIVNTLITLDENGIDISKTGEEMTAIFGYFSVGEETRLGLQVNRDTTEMMGIDNTGGRMENLTVRKYLVIGNNSRMETYQDGTGVFFVG